MVKRGVLRGKKKLARAITYMMIIRCAKCICYVWSGRMQSIRLAWKVISNRTVFRWFVRPNGWMLIYNLACKKRQEAAAAQSSNGDASVEKNNDLNVSLTKHEKLIQSDCASSHNAYVYHCRSANRVQTMESNEHDEEKWELNLHPPPPLLEKRIAKITTFVVWQN